MAWRQLEMTVFLEISRGEGRSTETGVEGKWKTLLECRPAQSDVDQAVGEEGEEEGAGLAVGVCRRDDLGEDGEEVGIVEALDGAE